MSETAMNEKATDLGAPRCATGSMGCLLPVAMLLVFGAAMVIAAAAYLLGIAAVPIPAIALGLLALMVFFAFGIAVLIFLFVQGGCAFGRRSCSCCCENCCQKAKA
jgi:hypothetical protein